MFLRRFFHLSFKRYTLKNSFHPVEGLKHITTDFSAGKRLMCVLLLANILISSDAPRPSDKDHHFACFGFLKAALSAVIRKHNRLIFMYLNYKKVLLFANNMKNYY